MQKGIAEERKLIRGGSSIRVGENRENRAAVADGKNANPKKPRGTKKKATGLRKNLSPGRCSERNKKRTKAGKDA